MSDGRASRSNNDRWYSRNAGERWCALPLVLAGPFLDVHVLVRIVERRGEAVRAAAGLRGHGGLGRAHQLAQLLAPAGDSVDAGDGEHAIGHWAILMEHFDGPDLDTGVWLPHYLPHWSSRADSAATYTRGGLRAAADDPAGAGAVVPGRPRPDQDLRDPVRRGLSGQHPFADGLVVKEDQPTWVGWTPHYGRLEVRARMDLSARSMAAVWMVGLEDEPDRSGEICIFEVFGDAPTAMGMGVQPLPRPGVDRRFRAPRVEIDIAAAARLRRRLATRRASTSSSTASTFAPSTRPRTTRCSSWSRSSTSRTRRREIEHVPEFAVDAISRQSRRPFARLRVMPSSTFATVSHASTADSSVSKMSFQRITIIGSMPATNRSAIAARWIRSPSFSSRWISTSCGPTSSPLRRPRRLRRDLLGGGDEHLGHRLRLLHRRLDGVERELVRGLLGEVDDVVERARQRVHVGRVQVRAPAPALRQPVQDVVDDPVALLLAQQDVALQAGLLREVRQQVAQQQRRALHVAPGLLKERQQFGVGPGPAQRHA